MTRLRVSRMTSKPRIMSSALRSITAAMRGARRGSSDSLSQNRTDFSGHLSAPIKNTSASVNTPSAAYAVGIIQPGECGPRSAKNATNTNSETSRPSTMRSTATVPSAADAEMPRLRMRPGRTSSPSRAGSARIAMKPTDEIASSGAGGMRTPSGASR
jgi:hypothetical protein